MTALPQTSTWRKMHASPAIWRDWGAARYVAQVLAAVWSQARGLPVGGALAGKGRLIRARAHVPLHPQRAR